VSQENVALLIRSNDAFRRGDWDAWGANFHPDVLVRTDPGWPEQIIFGRGATVDASGIEGEIIWSELLTVRDGRFVFIEMFFDHERVRPGGVAGVFPRVPHEGRGARRPRRAEQR
jgi:ketosteroid isomerase-like protein